MLCEVRAYAWVSVDSSGFICFVLYFHGRLGMRWVGSRGHLHKRRRSLLAKTDPYPQGEAFHLQIFIPCRNIVVSAQQGGPSGQA